MNFLEAKRIVSTFSGGDALPFLLAMSGTADPLGLYLQAAAAQRGRSARVRTLPFNTLGQSLHAEQRTDEPEVFLLLPWDLLPQCDWRSGFPDGDLSVEELRARAGAMCARLGARDGARFLYIPAKLMPLLGTQRDNEALELSLRAAATSIGATVLPPETFGLSSYLANGCPVASASLGRVAQAIIAALLPEATSACKVLVTDLDNVMWAGVIAEEGLDGVHFRSEGAGYRHFLYQSLLKRLKQEGILLAAVSRNDPAIALAPLQSNRMVLGEEDFVVVVASYHAKSAQIEMLSKQLNLGLDAFLFVDDNPLELAEVAQQLPTVKQVRFPTRDDEMPALLDAIRSHMPRTTVTTEDRERTQLYRRRLAGMAPSDVAGADLGAFLRDLEMRLTIHDRSEGDRTRAVQLINKTNQFNLNGRRVTDDEVAAALEGGGRLLTATLEDRHGSHGEVIACLITGEGSITSFVMSCRVFQRRAEFAFLSWLASGDRAPRLLEFTETPRNEPMRTFLQDPAFNYASATSVRFDADAFSKAHGGVREIVSLQFASSPSRVPA